MAVKIKEFVQNEWLTPGITNYVKRGDFQELSALSPSIDQRKLQRAPGWFPAVFHTNLVQCQAIFLDADNGRHVLIGKEDGASNLVSGYFVIPAWGASFTFTGTYTLLTGVTSLGGLSMQNVAYYAGRLYLIDGTNNYVYRSTGYTGSMGSAFWNDSSTASILRPFGNRLYMLTSDGAIWRINDADTALESYLTPTEDFTPLYATPFKGYLLVVALHDDGRLSLYRVSIPTATYFQELATTYNVRVNMPNAGCLFTVFEDKLFFSPGPQEKSSEHTAEIFTYNGTVLQKHSEFTVDTTVSTGTAGLLTWQSKLIYYVLTGTSPRFYALTGDGFTPYMTATMNFSSLSVNAIAHGSLDAILVTVYDSGECIQWTTYYKRQDGHVITSRMDFGHPGRQKRLERITVLLDGAATSFNVRIKYRTDDNTSWTTLITDANTRIVTSGGIDVDFYTLQIRAELDDDSALNHDIAIDTISVIYTEPD